MSKVGASSPTVIRFGVFEADLLSGELRKAGSRVPLQEQPFRVLVLLLRRSGEVVSREELQQALWSGDTFVDFEHGVNVAIARLREALGDEAGRPRFIETLPRRGYRFVAPVMPQPTDADAATGAAAAARSRWVRQTALAAAAVGALALGGGAAIWRFNTNRPVSVTERDTILITDFVNHTGDDVFDGTLKQALTIQLEQTPYLNVLSRERVRNTLRQMTRSPDDRVAGEMARELCQRAGAHILINGTIARIGMRHIIGLEAVTCESGETIASEQNEAPDREHVLDALGTAVAPLRQRLGESQATLGRFNRPLRDATTGSLNALKAFTIAEETREQRGELQAEPFYRRAIDLDPQLAMAHARLSAIYRNTSRSEQMRRAAELAFALRDRVTERERLYIELRFCGAGLSPELNCFQNLAELWKRTYRRDWVPYQALCFSYNDGGDFEKGRRMGSRPCGWARRTTSLMQV
jgi:DNA-binding winged helix-turn-helix (wHTH) protein/TolB-like protein